MKQRFRARELWLFAPFLVIGALALYWARVEQVSKAGASGMYISDVKVEAPSGYWQEQGYSHQVTVKLSHPWPRPKWWKDNSRDFEMNVSAPFPSPYGRYKNGVTASKEGWNGVLTTSKAGKTVALDYEYLYYLALDEYDGKDYVRYHLFKGNQLPPELGEITFRANYQIAKQAKTSLNLVVRKKGENITLAPDKRAGARIVKVITPPAELPPSASCNPYFSYFGLILQSEGASQDEMRSDIYDVELVDGKGHKININKQKIGLMEESASGIESIDKQQSQLQTGQVLRIQKLYLSDKALWSRQLTLRAKLKMGQRWPLQIEAVLPPREPRKK